MRNFSLTHSYHACPLPDSPLDEQARDDIGITSYPPQVQFEIDGTGDSQTNYDFSFF
jgi:hypothetical protein